MDFVGLDLDKTSRQSCMLSEGGGLKERRIKTTRASFDEVFAGPNFAPMYATRDKRIKTDKRDARALC